MKHLVVIGGGAAGFFCAVNAARLNPQLKVTIVEKTGKLLSKVKVSGGGRCNVTHACFDIAEMSKRYPRGANFVKKIFHVFFTTHTIEWFRERGVMLKTEADGRMFPVSDNSQTIVDCLLKEASRYGVQVLLNTTVMHLQPSGNIFELNLTGSTSLTAEYVCVACGGYPRIDMFAWLQQPGHTVEKPVPSLFTFNLPAHPIRELMGVSVSSAIIKLAGSKQQQEGPLLITHWGLSGPAVLKLSAWSAREMAAMDYNFKVIVNWLPGTNEQELSSRIQTLRQELSVQKAGNKNPFGLPARLWEFMLTQSGIKNDCRWADLPAKEANKLVKNLCTGEFDVKGKTTFKEEFVTAGGIKLSEVDHTTMMSKIVPNLFFAGEILDVDGVTGGFNFQHAWTSGYIAASAIAAESLSAK